RFEGVDKAVPAPGVVEAIQSAEAVIFCPSNPWVSIDPILKTLAPLHPLLEFGLRVVAVSPIIGGQTVKGPAAKMYRELGIDPSALAVANHYRGLVTDFVLDAIDKQLQGEIQGLNMHAHVTNTLMTSHDERSRLAQEIIGFIGNKL
ncbi:MAG TPA: 2-phospho-L-lactate transferase CofD family protein, partial [Anaerolineales bacterium]|nr:2-phospho-L-lactate transferase CofD family protein [Anaerolineales bacterium]